MTKPYSLTDLSLEEVNVILTGLGELPLKLSLSVFTKLRSQVDAQMAPVVDSPPAPAVDKPAEPDLKD